MTTLVTGAAGFIGFHTCRQLLERGDRVIGLDSLNDYYDPRLKRARLELLQAVAGFTFLQGDIADPTIVAQAFAAGEVTSVVHLAAQAGVRHSITSPRPYIDSNIVGFFNVLEACRAHAVRHLVFASSSSVYGLNSSLPFSPRQCTDHPISLYAATKKANEAMAHAYAHLYGIPVTGLRFFTVYGPWGRPDMALFKFTRAILAGEPIELYNHGRMRRDFTYVDDIVQAVLGVVDAPAVGEPGWDPTAPDPASSSAPYRIYNIGNSQPIELIDFIKTLEVRLGRKAVIQSLSMQPGDVVSTFADVSDLQRAIGFSPKTSIAEGIDRFATWYLEFYRQSAAGGAT